MTSSDPGAHQPITDAELADVVRIAAEAASAFLNGDLRQYLRLIKHSADYTLMPPAGGEPRRGFDDSDANLDAMARYFQGGEAELEVVHAFGSGDLAVLVAIERQHGVVGGRPDQDWSLRVTLVFRREEGEWRLAHRHADPLTHPLDMDVVAVIARGAAG
jgi:ketosteroid isomerase-like protein